MSDSKPRQEKTITLEMLQKMFRNIFDKTDWNILGVALARFSRGDLI